MRETPTPYTTGTQDTGEETRPYGPDERTAYPGGGVYTRWAPGGATQDGPLLFAVAAVAHTAEPNATLHTHAHLIEAPTVSDALAQAEARVRRVYETFDPHPDQWNYRFAISAAVLPVAYYQAQAETAIRALEAALARLSRMEAERDAARDLADHALAIWRQWPLKVGGTVTSGLYAELRALDAAVTRHRAEAPDA